LSKKAFIIDGHSLAHRFFFAMPPLATKGRPMGAVYGFAKTVLKLIQEEKPDFLAVAFDYPGPTFRHKQFPEYKAHRDKTPDDLQPQFGYIKEMLKKMSLPVWEKEGFEADDILGSLAKKLGKKDFEAIIVTGDKDSLQLVDDRVKVRLAGKETVDYTPAKISQEYGLSPEQLIDVKALMGDSSDNIPGVPGIGEKTAVKLIQKFGSIEDLLERRKEVSGKRGAAIDENEERVRFNKDLVTIDTKLDIDIEKTMPSFDDISWSEVAGLFREWEFSSLIDALPLKDEDRFKPDEEIDFETVDSMEEWEKVKNDFQPADPVALSWEIEGKRPLEYRLTKLAIGAKRKALIFSSGFIPEEVKELLKDENTVKIGHDFKPVHFLLDIDGVGFDTALGSYLQDPGSAPPPAEQLVERICGQPLSREKSDQRLAQLVNHLPRVAENLKEYLDENGLLPVLHEVEIPLTKVLAEMEKNGIKINLKYLEQLSGELDGRLKEIEKRAYQYAEHEFNLNSPKQLGVVLFEELKLPVIKRTKTGYGTGADVLEKLKEKHPIIEEILAYRQLSKLKSTYVDALPALVNEETKRLHTTFHQNVTSTGRLSSKDPNLQNIPVRTTEGQKIRRAFVAEKGYILLAADYSQIELRVLAHMIGEGGLQKAFFAGEDVHTRTASEVFAVEPEDVDSEMRRRAKAINFGLAYGMSAYGLSEDLGVTQKEAKEYIDRYFNRFPGMKNYIENCIAQARDKGYVETVLKRRRYLSDIKHRVPHRRNFAERMAVNTPIQGSAADIMKIAMLRVYNRLKECPGVRLLLQVHDELVLEVKENEVSEISRVVAEEMENAYSLDVPLEVDLKKGYNWMDMEGF